MNPGRDVLQKVFSVHRGAVLAGIPTTDSSADIAGGLRPGSSMGELAGFCYTEHSGIPGLYSWAVLAGFSTWTAAWVAWLGSLLLAMAGGDIRVIVI